MNEPPKAAFIMFNDIDVIIFFSALLIIFYSVKFIIKK